MIQPEIMLLSLISALFLTLIVLCIPAWLYKKTGRGFSLLDIIREAGWPSLARFQFLAWTLIIIFCFTTICIVRFLGGTLAIPADIPQNLLALMGISAGVTAVASGVSKSKYGEETKKRTKSEYRDFTRDKKFGTMLLENGAPSLTRFQMFSWTILSVFLYVSKFLASLGQFSLTDVDALVLPDIESTLLVLMGVSQAAYVGGKWVSPSAPKIFSVVYDGSAKKESIIVNGVNFGENTRIVMFDDTTIPKDKIEWDKELISFKVDPQTAGTQHTVTLKIGATEVEPFEFKI